MARTSRDDKKMTPEQKRVAEQLTSLFENGTIKIQYGYAEDLKDGRGITCGRSGFCTGTGDAYVVVKKYTKVVPNNPLAVYLPELKRLNTAEQRDDISGLRGFMAAWKKAARLADFRTIQDQVTDELYWYPSQKHADSLGLMTPLARAFMFDTIIQHGDGGDPDGLTALLMTANAAMGGTPKNGVPEVDWLIAIIKARRANLSYCYDSSSRHEWSGSTGRCDTYLSIAELGNFALVTPFMADWNGRKHKIQ